MGETGENAMVQRLFDRLAAIYKDGGWIAWLITLCVLVGGAALLAWLFGLDVAGMVQGWLT